MSEVLVRRRRRGGGEGEGGGGGGGEEEEEGKSSRRRPGGGGGGEEEGEEEEEERCDICDRRLKRRFQKGFKARPRLIIEVWILLELGMIEGLKGRSALRQLGKALGPQGR